MCNIKDVILSEVELLTADGNLSHYAYCEVLHIFLLERGTNNSVNYFTHINLLNEIPKSLEKVMITNCPKSINKKYQLGIIKYFITIAEYKECYSNAIDTQLWKYNDIQIKLDEVFFSNKKYIKAIDPTGGKYYLAVPIEWELYGSNFSGNYYVSELFSTKTVLSEILTTEDIAKIQLIINENRKSIGYKFNLENLNDRIGNVFCKLRVRVIESKPIKLSYGRGIEYKFSRTDKEQRDYTLQILQEHDGLIYQNTINSNFNLDMAYIEPNQCLNKITIIDNTTGLIVFSEEFDYNFYSDYFASISLTHWVAQIPPSRCLIIDGIEKNVELNRTTMAGEIGFLIEQKNANERLQKIYESKLKEHKYLCTYFENQHDEAMNDIVEIISGNGLLWDLEEVRVIDPYLTADEIIYPLLHCRKPNIIIKCLCAYQSLHSYSETKEKYNANSYINFKTNADSKLSLALSKNTDLHLEFRSIYEGKGIKFHDRYIILKFKLNKTRVWSLGASINSIGKSHSIMQIVNAPEVVYNLFEKLWEQTNDNKCLIYKTELSKEQDL